MSYDGAWLEDEGSEDSWGRALWSLGVTVTEERSPAHRASATSLFDEAAGHMLGIRSPQAMAFSMERAERAHAWFHGANDGGIARGDHASGDCCDGLTPTEPNLNRGAESVLAFHLASCAMIRLRAGASET